MSDNALEVYRALREGQNRYTYFLLAATGAAIGFALTQTHGSALALTQAPLGVAVFSWGISFFLGCMHVAYVNSTLYANFSLIKVQAGEQPGVGTNPYFMEAASEGIRQAITSNSDRADFYGHWQFRALIIGSVMYIAWHVLEMYLLAGFELPAWMQF